MLATDNAIGQLPGLSSLSDEVDACYPTVYEDTKGLVDAFVVFTSSFSAHIIGQDGAIIWKDITTYGIDSSSNLRITVYTSETSLFTLSFTDAGFGPRAKKSCYSVSYPHLLMEMAQEVSLCPTEARPHFAEQSSLISWTHT